MGGHSGGSCPSGTGPRVNRAGVAERIAGWRTARMVPNQDPDDILKRYTAYVKKLTPKGIDTKIKVWSKGPACVVGTDNKYVKASTEAMHDVFKKDTVFIRSGGSIPIVGDFERHLKIPSVMMGFGLPDDNLHAPNEKFHLANFYRGIESVIRFLEVVGK